MEHEGRKKLQSSKNLAEICTNVGAHVARHEHLDHRALMKLDGLDALVHQIKGRGVETRGSEKVVNCVGCSTDCEGEGLSILMTTHDWEQQWNVQARSCELWS